MNGMTNDERWAVVEKHDHLYDGVFFCAVKTTQIYCKPPCTARPLRKNVVFFENARQAEAAGFRACKRCRPDLLGSDTVRQDLVETAEYLSTIRSPVGTLTVSSDGASVTGLWLEGQKYFTETLHPGAERRELPVFESIREWLACYFRGKEPSFTPPLAPKGSPFRQKVWKILCAIPYGQVLTYGDIAQRLERQTGKRQSAQAVGGAVGHNPVSIIIPCHRVVGADGSLTGYAGGIQTKLRLLELEGASIEKFSIPSKGTAL